MKALAALAFATLACTGPALAGDAAELNILGFSEDGGVFAFEEFGVQDGSGFPYANRYYIDTRQDRFLPGTPVKVRLDDESASLEEARRQAQERGESIVPHETLADNRGFTAGARPVTQLSGDPHRIAVNPRAVFPPIDPPLEFRLEEIILQGADYCADFGPIKGYRLIRLGAQPGETASLLHEDKTLPASRNCAHGYGIGAVQTFFPQGGEPVYAVLIAVRSVGFEGPDHRWVAVPGRF